MPFLTNADIPGSAWQKARKSVNNGACVEVASAAGDFIAVRDSKNQSGPILAFTKTEWNAFIARVKSGEHDLG